MASRSSSAKKRRVNTSSKKGKSSQRNREVTDDVLLVLVLAVSVLLLFSTFGLLGNFGKAIGSFLFGLFGMVAYVFPFFFAFTMLFAVQNFGKKIASVKIWSALLFLIMLCCIAHLTFGHNVILESGNKLGYFYNIKDETHATGGFIGGVITYFLKKFLGTFGAVIVAIALTIISGVLFTEKSFFKSVKKGGENLAEGAKRRKEYRARQAEVYEIEKEERRLSNIQKSEERELARQKRLAQQKVKQDARLAERRERAEEARRLREENAEKAREEARIQYLKNQEEAKRLAEEEAQKALLKEKTDYESGEENEPITDFDTASLDEINKTIAEDVTSMAKESEYEIPEKEPEIMTFSGNRDSKRRLDNKVSGVMPHTRLFDMSEGNGDIREITPAFEGSVVNFEDKIFHTEHRINVSGDIEEVSNTDSAIRTYDSYDSAVKEEEADDFDFSFEERPFMRRNHFEDDKYLNDDSDNINADEAFNGDIEEISSEDLDDLTESDESTGTPVRKTAPVRESAPAAKPVVKAGGNVQKTTEQKALKAPAIKGRYKFPPISLLNEVTKSNGSSARDELKETGDKLKDILKTFGVNVTISGALRGPSVTRYEIQPEIGTKVSKIVALTDDIKMALAATDIRMEAPIPGKSAIGIEVPNKENSAVQYRELVESRTFKDAKSKISFAVGKDLNGQVVVSDIAKMPHVLIAGATGSGKSVCINTLIMSILYKASPEDVRLIMIDPKVVELSVYNGIPHLLLPVVTDPKQASASLQWAVNEMMRRYECFKDLQVRDMTGYNKVLSEDPSYAGSEVHKKMPQIVIIVDELADLMMVASKEVEESICRLAQLARAAGIHLILATQRPSVNVVTGLIKANMPSRIAFAVSSGIDSRTILDMVGAEKLLGKGDMLFYPQSYTKPARVQGAFVSDDEVKRVVEFLKSQTVGDPYDDTARRSVENPSVSGSNGSSGGGFAAPESDNGFDPLFYEAGKSIIEKEKASIGMLQRIHKIGFNRAARIMDQLSEAGVVGPEEGTKPRQILMTMDEFEAFIQENNQ